MLLYFVPVLNIAVNIWVSIGLAEKFGKGALMGLVVAFLPFIGYPILAFSDAEYSA